MPYRFSYIEDYIEIIAGLREPNGKPTGLFAPMTPLINLARYDMKIIPSLANQTYNHTSGYSDKQAQLAAQLVIKYEKQLLKQGIDVSPAHNPQYRLPIRVIDRSCRVWIDDDKIKMRFPYVQESVDLVREATQNSQGTFEFDREKGYYVSALTEWNLNWIYSFAKARNFEIDASVENLMHRVFELEKQPWAIELVYKDSALDINNAPDSLIDYVQNHLGGFDIDNLFRLCDYAPLLGYSISKQIEQDIIDGLGLRFFSLCVNSNLKSDGTEELAKQILDYAHRVDRFPIYVYEPDLTEKLYGIFSKFLQPEQICRLDNNNKNITNETRMVYVNRIPKKYFIDHIPLMVSSAGMMFGGERQAWLQAAQKVVYFSHEVYNKHTQGNQICRLD